MSLRENVPRAARRHPTRGSPLRKPLAVIVPHRDDVGRLTLDRDVAWPRQRRAAGLRRACGRVRGRPRSGVQGVAGDDVGDGDVYGAAFGVGGAEEFGDGVGGGGADAVGELV